MLAVAGLMLAGVPEAGAGAEPDMVFVTICGDSARTIPMPINRDGRHRRRCPMACHAACAQREADEDDE